MKALLIIIITAAVFLAVSCSPPKPSTSTDATTTESAALSTVQTGAMPEPTPTQEEKPMSNYENKIAEIHTRKGVITVKFLPDLAPNHVRNFIDLSEQGYYNGTRFHRVIPGFMIQGGDPNTKTDNQMNWGTGGSGKNLKAEFSSRHHSRGILSMARSQDPDSASSQFFITVADAASLDNQYTVFGEVLTGMDVADQIVNAPRNARDVPAEPVAIERIVVRDAKETDKGASK